MNKCIRVLTILVAASAAFAVAFAIALCAVFPNKYAKAIDSAAEEFDIDPALVRSVVWAESKFDATAVSEKGACGLMQMMPGTYEFCAKALSIAATDDGIFDVENSLRCGCYYLSLLLEKYDNNTESALMAYNAGEKNADKFIAGGSVFEETQKYVKRVALANKVYSMFF